LKGLKEIKLMPNSQSDKLAVRPGASLVNARIQVAITDKILKSIRNVKPSIFDNFTDQRDGNVYKTVKIGDQVWMAENFRYIPHVYPANENGGIWVYGFEGKNVLIAIEEENYKEFGCLYNWETAISVTPKGWHLPTEKEWSILIDSLGGMWEAGGKLKLLTGWRNDICHEKPTNETGFSADGCGCRSIFNHYENLRWVSYLWSGTSINNSTAHNTYLNYMDHYAAIHESYKNFGFGVRYLKDIIS
jgi:uncharacterized protein (TIGR02145 family)